MYDYLIMDEASQVDIATGSLALSCAKNVVIVGDTKQLPNVALPCAIVQQLKSGNNSGNLLPVKAFVRNPALQINLHPKPESCSAPFFCGYSEYYLFVQKQSEPGSNV